MPYSSPFGPKAIPVGRSTFRSPVSVQAPPAGAGRNVNTVAKVVPYNAPPAPTTPAEGLSSSTWKAYSVVREGGVWARAAENMKTASDAAGRSANAVLRNLAGSLILLFVGEGWPSLQRGIAGGPRRAADARPWPPVHAQQAHGVQVQCASPYGWLEALPVPGYTPIKLKLSPATIRAF